MRSSHICMSYCRSNPRTAASSGTCGTAETRSVFRPSSMLACWKSSLSSTTSPICLMVQTLVIGAKHIVFAFTFALDHSGSSSNHDSSQTFSHKFALERSSKNKVVTNIKRRALRYQWPNLIFGIESGEKNEIAEDVLTGQLALSNLNLKCCCKKS